MTMTMTIPSLRPTPTEIRKRAYCIWLETGNPDARANWLQAESDQKREMKLQHELRAVKSELCVVLANMTKLEEEMRALEAKKSDLEEELHIHLKDSIPHHNFDTPEKISDSFAHHNFYTPEKKSVRRRVTFHEEKTSVAVNYSSDEASEK